MIKSIRLENFQSHKDTLIEFNKGVNCIIGSSRSGKTAILRGLNWNRYNKPVGTSLNSYWNRNKNKQPINLCKSTICLEENTISRARNTEFNGYIVNDNKLEAIGQNIPELVENIWNTTDVNIQYQFSTPFLISESAAEIARFFNKTIKLDKIDSVLSNAESQRRKLGQELANIATSIKETEKSIVGMNWLDDVNNLVISAKRREERLNKKCEEYDKLSLQVDEILNRQIELKSLSYDFDNILKKMEDAKSFDNEIEKKAELIAELTEITENIIDFNVLLSTYPKDLDATILKIEKAEEIKSIILNNKKIYYDITDILSRIKISNDNIRKNNIEIKILEEQLPKLCPYCGSKLEANK